MFTLAQSQDPKTFLEFPLGLKHTRKKSGSFPLGTKPTTKGISGIPPLALAPPQGNVWDFPLGPKPNEIYEIPLSPKATPQRVSWNCPLGEFSVCPRPPPKKFVRKGPFFEFDCVGWLFFEAWFGEISPSWKLDKGANPPPPPPRVYNERWFRYRWVIKKMFRQKKHNLQALEP